MKYLLAIDQGTTSSRCIIFTTGGQIIATHQIEIKQYYPEEGWVEHDPLEIWQTQLDCIKHVLQTASISNSDLLAIGISNQRETTIIWDKETGEPIYPAIVWQDRRTAAWCETHAKDAFIEEELTTKTGLLLDPYFSATKIAWILEHVAGAREKAQAGRLLFGTIDTWLLWQLTAGEVHATDATNAARTLLFDITTGEWDRALLDYFNIPMSILPKVQGSVGHFGYADAALFGVALPITSILGDQQAASFGQHCFKPGQVKITFGTGCFMLLNTGDKILQSRQRLLSTIAYQLNGQRCYAFEGSIFVAGAAVQWLRDAVHLIHNAKETEQLALEVADNGGVYLVPAFTGLGAPYWDPDARGALVGLTRNSGVAHIVRAALEAVSYQAKDLLLAMQKDGANIKRIKVDGGMAKNNWLLQFLADILQLEIERPTIIESSAWGVAQAAGLGVGYFKDLKELQNTRQLDRVFKPKMSTAQAEAYYAGWLKAIRMVMVS